MIREMLEFFTQSTLYQVRVIEALRTSPKNSPHRHCHGKASVGSETVNSLVFRQCHEIRVIRNYPCAQRTARSCKPLVNTRHVPVETVSPLTGICQTQTHCPEPQLGIFISFCGLQKPAFCSVLPIPCHATAVRRDAGGT